jgi:FkbM family methyltransferase
MIPIPTLERQRIEDAIWRWLAPDAEFLKMRVWGHDMVIPNSGGRGTGSMFNLLRGRLHEPATTELVVKEVKPGQTVVDIGANVGYFSLLFARAVGQDGIVHAFEPNPRLARILRYNLSLNGYRNVVVNQKAVSDRNGSARFYVPKQGHERSSLEPRHSSQIIDVATTKLDDYFEPKEDRVDWIKLDVEGHETKALKGMRAILRSNKGIRLIVEFIPERPGFDEEAYFNELDSFSYKPVDRNLLCWRDS